MFDCDCELVNGMSSFPPFGEKNSMNSVRFQLTSLRHWMVGERKLSSFPNWYKCHSSHSARLVCSSSSTYIGRSAMGWELADHLNGVCSADKYLECFAGDFGESKSIFDEMTFCIRIEMCISTQCTRRWRWIIIIMEWIDDFRMK